MGMIEMNKKERQRLKVMSRVSDGLLKLGMAGEMMEVCYRQAKRIWKRYQQEGDRGVIHKGRGQASPHSRPERERERAVALYAKRYAGFGPLLASEHLATDHHLVVDHETLRRWLIEAKLWESRRKREKHRAARERRPRRGDLVQIDGSEHDWFEGRGPRAVLMVMIDDATNTTLARFYPAEDFLAACDILERYTKIYGLPAALYPDRDSIYVCTREACLDEQLAQVGPETQFARALRELGVQLIPAYSPQAKGRVERRHGLFQDRLVKEMRLRGLCTIEGANAYLDDIFLPMINKRYTVQPADPANGHQTCPSSTTLTLALAWQEPRTVAKDWTVRWRNRKLQIDARHAALDLPKRRVSVVEQRNGTLSLLYNKRLLTFRDAPAPALPSAPIARPPVWHRSTAHVPAPNHPWRQYSVRHSRPPPTSSAAHSRGAESRTTLLSQPQLQTT